MATFNLHMELTFLGAIIKIFCEMAKATLKSPVKLFLLAIIKMASEKAQEPISGRMEHFLKEPGKTTREMGRELS